MGTDRRKRLSSADDAGVNDSAIQTQTRADSAERAAVTAEETDRTSANVNLPTPVEKTDLALRTSPETRTVDRRTYVEIRPTEKALSPRAVNQAMTHLHAALERATETGFRDLLTRSTTQPSIEWLLVSDGRADTSIRYLVGATETSLTEELERIVRTALPNTYECRLVEWHPHDVLDAASGDALADLYTPPTDRGDRASTATPPVAGVQFHGEADRQADWHLPLSAFETFTAKRRRGGTTNQKSRRLPLTTLVETLADTSSPVIYQVLARPYQEITPTADEYRLALADGTASLSGKIWEALSPRSMEERRAYEPTPADSERIEALEERETRRTFQVTARAVVCPDETGTPPREVAESLASSLSPLSGAHHYVDGVVEMDTEDGSESGTALFDALCDRVQEPVSYGDTWNRIRRRWTSAGMVLTPAELPGLCLLDGSALTPTGQRAIGIRHSERTGIPLPPPAQLRRYQPPGMALCRPLTSDRLPLDEPLVLPPQNQSRHQVVVGNTGAGKSVLTIGAMLSNTHATDGPAILFDYKGGGTAREYLQAHYRTQGTLENVVYFDLTSVLPALSFFDIEPLLEAGLPREEARSRKTGHYEEILRGVMPPGQYDEATESPKVIRNHLRALYDPVHGSDAFAHSKLYTTIQRTQGKKSPPPVSEDTFETYFAGLLERDSKVFTKVLGGAISRVETIATDARLAPLFDHMPGDSDARFDFADVIDDDQVVIFDFGGMETQVKRTLTLVLLSNLWTALKARREKRGTDADLTQVNLYLEEARDIAETELVDTLLSQGRSFGLSILLGVQYLEQLDSPDPANDTYREALNETATFVVGNVSVDRHLSSVLATGDMPPQEVERRLAALGRGEWMIRPGSGFGESTVRPFLGESLPAPPGHPASGDPLEGVVSEAFERAFDRIRMHTRNVAGIELTEPNTIDAERAGDEGASGEDEAFRRVDSLLPYTQRLPRCIEYSGEAHTLTCTRCETRFDRSIQGMIRAIECCHSLVDVETDDIPICEVNLKLSPEEIRDSEYSLRQLLFMQAVYNVQQGLYDPPEFDLLQDSMVRLQEYTGIETDAVDELIEDGLVGIDTDRPHRLYSVRPEGRKIIEEAHSHGVAYGHGEGDLDESTEHVLGVEVAVRWLTKAYAEDPDSDVVTVHPYYDLRKGSIDAGAFFGDGEDVDDAIEGFQHHRLDVAGLDEEGEVVVTMEVERINHDTRRAVPEDYDKMAACHPQKAIWMAMSHSEAHEILHALNDPLEGEPRVEKTYSENSPASAFRIDRPGFTDIYTLEQLREKVLNWEDADDDDA